MSNPLFVIGMSRSGTSYLHGLVNRHPAIRLSYEGKIPTEGYALYKQLKPLQDQQAFTRFIEQLVHLDHNEPKNQWIAASITADSCAKLFQMYQEDSTFQTIVENLYQLVGGVEYWGNKMLRIELVPRVLDLWPDAKFIVLVRDPRAVYASQKKFSPFRRLKALAIYYNLHSGWVQQNCNDPAQYLVVKYEDFVTDSVAHLGNVLRFLDLWDEQSVYNILEQFPAHAKSLDKWRNTLAQGEIHEIESYCFRAMVQNGYHPNHAKTQKPINMWTRLTEVGLENLHRIPLNPADWYRKSLLQRFWISIRSTV